MRLKLPKPRLSLRTVAVLIAILAVTLWAGLSIWSPTRRLGRLLQSDQQVHVSSDAASALGYEIPWWEVDQAVRMLIQALDDPSPRVREYACLGLCQIGPRAQRATPKIITLLNDEDRLVRDMAAASLGVIIDAGSVNRAEAVTALNLTLDDRAPDVRLTAAEALVKIGEAQKALRIILAAYGDSDSHLRDRARSAVRGAKDPRPFFAMLAKGMRTTDGQRRDEALQSLMYIASPEAVRSALKSALTEDNPAIRQWAAERLKRITPSR